MSASSNHGNDFTILRSKSASTIDTSTADDDGATEVARQLERSRNVVALIERQAQDRCRQRQQIRVSLYDDVEPAGDVSADGVFLTNSDFVSALDETSPGRTFAIVNDIKEMTTDGEQPERVLKSCKSARSSYRSSLSQKALARLRELKNVHYEFPVHTSPRDSAELDRINKALKSLLESTG